MEQKQQSFSTIGYIAAALWACASVPVMSGVSANLCGKWRRSIYFSVDNCDVDFRSSASFGGDGNW